MKAYAARTGLNKEEEWTPDSFIYIAKSLVDKLNATHARGAISVGVFTQAVSSISFYDALVAIEKHPRLDG